MEGEFYITLPSNSSIAYFPENTLSSFKTKLCKRIELKENYVVGLISIHHPTALTYIRNLPEQVIFPRKRTDAFKDHLFTENSIYLTSTLNGQIYDLIAELPIARYETIEDVIDNLNTQIRACELAAGNDVKLINFTMNDSKVNLHMG